MCFLEGRAWVSTRHSGLSLNCRRVWWHQICIMQRDAWSCFDDTAFLKPPGVRDVKWWLGSKCDLKPRSMERHLPQLARLDLLVWGDGGFRLPRFYQFHRQNGGPDRAKLAANLSAKMAARKESIWIIGNTLPTPLSGGKLSRRQRRRREALGLDRDELHEFTVARCEVCLVHHDWEVR